MSYLGSIQTNELLNNREYDAGTAVSSSLPQYVTIGAHHRCNARCVFCLGGEYAPFDRGRFRDFFEPKLGAVLSKAKHVGFCGWGEILLMPGIEGFIDHLQERLPSNTKVFTTNGLALTSRLSDQLCGYSVPGAEAPEALFSLLVSMHASNTALHEALTGMNAFDRIAGQVLYLTQRRGKTGARVYVKLIFLATAMNIGNLPQFVKFACYLGVDAVSCNYLTVYEPEQLKYSCWFHQEKTNEMFARARELAERYHLTLDLPPAFGQAACAAARCSDPWKFFYVESQGTVNSCCFAGDHAGDLEREEFSAIWNGPGYTRLRETLAAGGTPEGCRYCYRRDPRCVDDLRSHITFRPGARRRILEYLKEHSAEFPVSPAIDG